MVEDNMDIAGLRSGQRPIAIIGAGLIGCSWAALFAAAGREVRLFDTHADTRAAMDALWPQVKPALMALGLTEEAFVPRFVHAATLEAALDGVELVQENIPERLALKTALYTAMEPCLPADAIVATSSSGLKLSDLQTGWADPSRLIIAHPFNPPHLVPLVELYANDRTAADVLPRARAIYEAIGKVTITLKREVMGHVANRLQAALWREAISLVAEDVASVADVDTAVWAGPGLRWGVMGPHLLLNLGGGEGGLRAYCQQFRDSYHEWWDDLGTPKLTDDVIDRLVDGLGEEIDRRSYAEIREDRDARLIATLGALRGIARD